MPFTSPPYAPVLDVAQVVDNPAKSAGTGRVTSAAAVIANNSPYVLNVVSGSGSPNAAIYPFTRDIVALDAETGQELTITPMDIGQVAPSTVKSLVTVFWYQGSESVPENLPIAIGNTATTTSTQQVQLGSIINAPPPPSIVIDTNPLWRTIWVAIVNWRNTDPTPELQGSTNFFYNPTTTPYIAGGGQFFRFHIITGADKFVTLFLPTIADPFVEYYWGADLADVDVMSYIGGTMFPTFSGAGSPEGVQRATQGGQTYEDLTTGAIYFFNGNPPGDTGWVAGAGSQPAWPVVHVAGVFFEGAGPGNGLGILGDPAAYPFRPAVYISDIVARSQGGSGNGLNWQTPAGDGNQWMDLFLGPDGIYQWIWSADGMTSFPRNIVRPVLSESAPYVMDGTETVIITDSAVSLYEPNAYIGAHYTIKDNGAGTASLNPNAGEKIDGVAAPIALAPYHAITVVSDGTDWFIIAVGP